MILSKLQIIKLLGIGWVVWRLLYTLRLKIGHVESKTPIQKWDHIFAPKLTGKVVFNEVKNENAVTLAKEIVRQRYIYFFHHHISSQANPNWFGNPFEKKQFDKLNKVHWSKVSDFEYGDIKCIWELSRFAWAYPLMQAYSTTGDELFSDVFWRLVEDWAQNNPPNQGIHWKCGQEITIRMLALVTGYFVLQPSQKTTYERSRLVRKMLYVSAKRIDANIGYALRQSNNHGISEATGLFTGGVLLKDKDWIEKGRRLLERQVTDLIYDDGSFSQHSANYHRVMLHACLWAIQIGRANGIDLSRTFIQKIRNAGEWLLAIYNPQTGHVPNLGSNDGALILPYSNCDYQDYRPTIQTVGAVVDGNRWLPAGPWDDMALWLVPNLKDDDSNNPKCNPIENLKSQKHKAQLNLLPEGGYAIFTNQNTNLLFRCPEKFRHRPGQCDLLHVDVWHNGVNILRDAGTYSYHCEQPWQNYFKSVAAHNTVQFDDHDQMPILSRFLYGQWPELSVAVDVSSSRIKAGFTDWKRCFHQRSVIRVQRGFKVIDEISGRFIKAVLRWRLAPELDWNLSGNICSTNGVSLQIGGCAEKSIHLASGWESQYYMDKTQLSVLETIVGANCKKISTYIEFT